MSITDFKQNQDRVQNPSTYHRHHPRHQQHRHQQLQQQQHSRFLSLLLLPGSPTVIVSILIMSSAWALPSCCALDSHLSRGHSNVARTTSSRSSSSSSSDSGSKGAPSSAHGTRSKRTILPFHFELLQDYLHQHGVGGTVLKHDVRYPVEMLFPPGVRIAADSSSQGPWWRSRRSVPPNVLSPSARSKSYQSRNPHSYREMSLAAFPPSQHKDSVPVDSFVYPSAARIAADVLLEEKLNNKFRSSRFNSKSFSSGAKNAPSRSKHRYRDRIRQKQRIIDALRRRDKANIEVPTRDSKLPSQFLPPTLEKSVTKAFRDLQMLKARKAFVRKHKNKSHKNIVRTPVTLDARGEKQGGFSVDPFTPVSSRDQNSFGRATGGYGDFFNEAQTLEPIVDLNSMEGFVSSVGEEEETSPLLPAFSVGESFQSGPVEMQDVVVLDGGFGEGQGFSGLDGFSESPVDDGFVSAAAVAAASTSSGSFSHAETFPENPVAFPEKPIQVTSSLGADNEDGFGDFWGEGDFVVDNKDCADIDTKTCDSHSECSCYGFYVCSQDHRCEAMSASQQQTPTNGIWLDSSAGFGLSKRHAIHLGRSDSASAPELDLTGSQANKSGTRRRCRDRREEKRVKVGMLVKK